MSFDSSPLWRPLMLREDLHKAQGEPQLHLARDPASPLPAPKRHIWTLVVKSGLKIPQAMHRTEELPQGHTEGTVRLGIMTAGWKKPL